MPDFMDNTIGRLKPRDDVLEISTMCGINARTEPIDFDGMFKHEGP
jgi:hypothetical protein